MPLDRFSFDAMFPNCMGKQWVGANGDWIATTGFRGKLELCNVYTHRKIVILQVPGFEPTEGSALTF